MACSPCSLLGPAAGLDALRLPGRPHIAGPRRPDPRTPRRAGISEAQRQAMACCSAVAFAGRQEPAEVAMLARRPGGRPPQVGLAPATAGCVTWTSVVLVVEVPGAVADPNCSPTRVDPFELYRSCFAQVEQRLTPPAGNGGRPSRAVLWEDRKLRGRGPAAWCPPLAAQQACGPRLPRRVSRPSEAMSPGMTRSGRGRHRPAWSHPGAASDHRSSARWRRRPRGACAVMTVVLSGGTVEVEVAEGLVDVGVHGGVAGPPGLRGQRGESGDPGGTTTVVYAFGAVRTPDELPPGGLIPVGWDGANRPSSDLQLAVGESAEYQPDGYLWLFVGPSVLPAGWIETGQVRGPPGGPEGQTRGGASVPPGALGPAGGPGRRRCRTGPERWTRAGPGPQRTPR